MYNANKKLTQAEMDDAEEVAKFLKLLTPKEKERILYMLQGVALISEAVRNPAENVSA